MPQYRRRAAVVELTKCGNEECGGYWVDGRKDHISAEEFAATYEPVSEAAHQHFKFHIGESVMVNGNIATIVSRQHHNDCEPSYGVVFGAGKPVWQSQIQKHELNVVEGNMPKASEPAKPPVEDWLESQDFYELMQAYRHTPVIYQSRTVSAFEDVKAAIRAHQTDWRELCERHKQFLIDVGEMLNTWHSQAHRTPTRPATGWSEWDESIRQRGKKLLAEVEAACAKEGR